MGMLSENSLSVLNQIGNLSWNGAAGAAQNPQQQNIGLVNEQGQPRVITFEGRDFGLLPQDAANAEGSNALRTKLQEIAEEAGLKPDVLADIQRKLGLTTNMVRSGNVQLLDRKIAGEVARQILDASAHQVEENIRAFRDFAAQHGNAGDFYVRLTGNGAGLESAGRRNIFRGSASKQENDAVRQQFFDSVSAHYKGNIPENVRTVMTNFNGGGHPLSAKRIGLICQAMDAADLLGNLVEGHGLTQTDMQLVGKFASKARDMIPAGQNRDMKTLKALLGADKIPADASHDAIMMRVACAYVGMTPGVDKELLDELSRAGVINALKRLNGDEIVSIPGAAKLLMESGNCMQVPANLKERANGVFSHREQNPIPNPYSPEGVRLIKSEITSVVDGEMPTHLIHTFNHNNQYLPNNPSSQWGGDATRTTGFVFYGNAPINYQGAELANDDAKTKRVIADFQAAVDKYCEGKQFSDKGKERIFKLFQSMTFQGALGNDSAAFFLRNFSPPNRDYETFYSVDSLPDGGLRFRAMQKTKCPYFSTFAGEEPDDELQDVYNGEKSFYVKEIVYDFSSESISRLANTTDDEWQGMLDLYQRAQKQAKDLKVKDMVGERDRIIVDNLPGFITEIMPKVDVNYVIKAVPLGD